MAAERTIFHVDLDAFFAAAERSVNPDLIGKPPIIGGAWGRGVVACA
ncbi:MAG: DNA polymerase IV, partial [Chloroflexi bacterium]|nr:DNA polymerase IV [Chloroflexota bacterium]